MCIILSLYLSCCPIEGEMWQNPQLQRNIQCAVNLLPIWRCKLSNSPAIKIHLKHIMLLMQRIRLWGKRESGRGQKFWGEGNKKKEERRHGKEKWCSRQFNAANRKETFHMISLLNSHPVPYSLQLLLDATSKPFHSRLKKGTTDGVNVIKSCPLTLAFLPASYTKKQSWTICSSLPSPQTVYKGCGYCGYCDPSHHCHSGGDSCQAKYIVTSIL